MSNWDRLQGDPFYATKATVDQAHVDTGHDGRVDLMRGVFCIVQTTAGGVTDTRLVLQGLAGEAGNRKLVYVINKNLPPVDIRAFIPEIQSELGGTLVQISPGMAKADASARMDGWIEQNKGGTKL